MIKEKNNIVQIIFIILVILGSFYFFKKDTYIGFYYPDADNLFNDIQSGGTFESIQECRAWVNEQVNIYNKDNSSYDYECGKNCNTSKGKPYVCEETLE